MEYYVGLDVSLKQTSLCVVNRTGSIVQEGVVDSDPEAIASFVRSRAPGTVRIGIETGPTTTCLWTELKRLGLPVICTDARHAKAVLKMQINKSDRNDAAGVARIMQTGWFKEVRCAIDRVADTQHLSAVLTDVTRGRWRPGHLREFVAPEIEATWVLAGALRRSAWQPARPAMATKCSALWSQPLFQLWPPIIR